MEWRLNAMNEAIEMSLEQHSAVAAAGNADGGRATVEITFVENSGKAHVIVVTAGQSLMQSAVRNDVPGIDAECGGACACATCHVYVDPAWWEAVGEPEHIERSMMEFTSQPAANSRLSCQITVTEKLHGLVVRIPETQG